MTLTPWVLSEIWQYSQWWLHFIGNFTNQWNYIVLLKSNWFELALKFLFALSKDEKKNPIRLSPFSSFILSKKQKIEYCIPQHVEMEFPGILGEFDWVILGIRSRIAFWDVVIMPYFIIYIWLTCLYHFQLVYRYINKRSRVTKYYCWRSWEVEARLCPSSSKDILTHTTCKCCHYFFPH